MRIGYILHSQSISYIAIRKPHDFIKSKQSIKSSYIHTAKNIAYPSL